MSQLASNSDKSPPDAQPSGERTGDARDYASARDRQRVIGDRLRKLFDEVVAEPVPDEFLKLLEDADRGEENDQKRDDPDPGSES